jgi:hypothetical protein
LRRGARQPRGRLPPDPPAVRVLRAAVTAVIQRRISNCPPGTDGCPPPLRDLLALRQNRSANGPSKRPARRSSVRRRRGAPMELRRLTGRSVAPGKPSPPTAHDDARSPLARRARRSPQRGFARTERESAVWHCRVMTSQAEFWNEPAVSRSKVGLS